MARINQDLLNKIMQKRNVGQARAYALIDEAGRKTTLPRSVAALVVARNAGVNIARFASDEDLTLIRAIENNRPISHQPRPAVAPAPVTPKGRSVRTGRPGIGANKRAKGNKVWVVYGRNESLRKSLFAFLRTVGLSPIEWNSAIAHTKNGSPYIGQVLDAGFSKAIATVVLLTPDDEAKLKDEFFRRKSDPIYEARLTGQPRPNVLFEAGMAFGHHPDNTVIVQVGKIRPISDLTGRHIVHLDDSVESRHQLIIKLRRRAVRSMTRAPTGTQPESSSKLPGFRTKRGPRGALPDRPLPPP